MCVIVKLVASWTWFKYSNPLVTHRGFPERMWNKWNSPLRDGDANWQPAYCSRWCVVGWSPPAEMMTEVNTPNRTPALGRAVEHAGSIPQMCPHGEASLPGRRFLFCSERGWRESEEEMLDCTPEHMHAHKESMKDMHTHTHTHTQKTINQSHLRHPASLFYRSAVVGEPGQDIAE